MTSALLVSFKLSVHLQICLSWPRRQRLITRCERHVDVKRSNPKAFHSTFVAHTHWKMERSFCFSNVEIFSVAWFTENRLLPLFRDSTLSSSLLLKCQPGFSGCSHCLIMSNLIIEINYNNKELLVIQWYILCTPDTAIRWHYYYGATKSCGVQHIYIYISVCCFVVFWKHDTRL